MSNLGKATVFVLSIWILGQAVAYFYGGKDAAGAAALGIGMLSLIIFPIVLMALEEYS